jgi:hypothetical protein
VAATGLSRPQKNRVRRAAGAAPGRSSRAARLIVALPERPNNRVKVSLSRGDVVLPWASRTALLDEIRHLDSAKPIVDAFEAVGTSRPVTLTDEQKGTLAELVEFWATQTRDGFEGLPEGLFELRNALHDDLHDSLRRQRDL